MPPQLTRMWMVLPAEVSVGRMEATEELEARSAWMMEALRPRARMA